VGDVLLKTIAERLNTVLRPSDQIARISRDKFLVLLPDTRIAEGRQVAEKLSHAVGSSPLSLSPHPLSVHMGVAVVQAPKETYSIEEILELAHSELKTDAQPEGAIIP
jgi:diguanylate cyclase (GGDEF)-like protein